VAADLFRGKPGFSFGKQKVFAQYAPIFPGRKSAHLQSDTVDGGFGDA